MAIKLRNRVDLMFTAMGVITSPMKMKLLEDMGAEKSTSTDSWNLINRVI